MTVPSHRPSGRTLTAAVVAVAATYVYFLLFAQFGFLKIVTALAPGAIPPVMGVMGLGGVAGSILAARLFRVAKARGQLSAGFAVCALTAALATGVRAPGLLYGVALLVGLGTGFTTVALAATLRPALGGGRLGAVIGLGTGLAYGVCNLPAVFAAGGTTQAAAAGLAAVAGFGAVFLLNLGDPAPTPKGPDHEAAGVAGWTLIFLALVALDSAAFYLIQHTPALKAVTWSGSGQLWANAGIHLGAAVLAGWALDRAWLGQVAFIASAGLLAACLLLGGNLPAAGVILYAAGVSLYSTILVFYPASDGRPGVAGLVYGVAGWGGSAAGIGLASTWAAVPGWFLLAAALLIGGALLERLFRRRRGTGPGS